MFSFLTNHRHVCGIHLIRTVGQILVVILYASHIFGCLWWVTSRYDEDASWWQRDGLEIDDATSTYIASLYWAATTITTVRRNRVRASNRGGKQSD